MSTYPRLVPQAITTAYHPNLSTDFGVVVNMPSYESTGHVQLSICQSFIFTSYDDPQLCSNIFIITFTPSDLDGNGYWDQMEVKALFKKELDKMYDPNAPEDDLTERYEEMERMREHVFRESDSNKDNLIR